ncbi:septum site-determining protein MinC [Caldibacillus lycopersici]|uniref:Probable septum site-determining protein MinC n=1 Tax=Perspicuibacillus lycopersici TaxID=1325689 RepID=A0AAE3IXV2_9BACI|nr:septum site-determining protein MinC [Perspicuibacillus lycopersici]MCU9614010.1 septum site-determining protein MinC [Perspicuibacillus lycopersici]
MVKLHNVMIKGTKDGLLLHLDDRCSFSELLNELEDKLLPHQQVNDDSHVLNVRIHTGNRFLSKNQEKKIKEIVGHKKNLQIESIDSNVILKKDAERIKRESEIQVITKIVRSGQILNITGDVLLIGDINPGGKVMASGNIFILGSLKGIAHAGCLGNEEAVICASKMSPTQLRIADCFTRAPDREEDKPQEAECAYVNDAQQIIIDKLIVLKKIRPNLNRFVEGGL